MEEMKMQTIHTKGALIYSLGLGGVIGMIWILSGGHFLWKADNGGYPLIFMGIFCFLLFAYAGLKIYYTHWIKYGDGKIVIRRVSKELVNGSIPVGKWENREDEFLLEEIEAYGLSMQVFGTYVEYHKSSRRSLTTECFFQFKDGRKIGYETGYYTRKQEREFFDYIWKETGIKLIKSKAKQ